MGCDIHAHTEVKINGKWEHVSDLHIRRSYDLFSRMANVRNDGEIVPISEPRGLPSDVSYLTKFARDYCGSDGHSDSWLSGAELESLEDWYSKQPYGKTTGFWLHDTFGYLFGNGWDVHKYPDDYPPGVEDSRIVFWFDN